MVWFVCRTKPPASPKHQFVIVALKANPMPDLKIEKKKVLLTLGIDPSQTKIKIPETPKK